MLLFLLFPAVAFALLADCPHDESTTHICVCGDDPTDPYNYQPSSSLNPDPYFDWTTCVECYLGTAHYYSSANQYDRGCIPCDPACADCSGDSGPFCTGFEFLSETVLTPYVWCTSGWYPKVTQLWAACLQCSDSHCTNCTSFGTNYAEEGACVSCETGYYLVEGTCTPCAGDWPTTGLQYGNDDCACAGNYGGGSGDCSSQPCLLEHCADCSSDQTKCDVPDVNHIWISNPGNALAEGNVAANYIRLHPAL